MMAIAYTTLIEALRDRAAHKPDRPAITYIYEDRPEDEVSNAQWYADALAFGQSMVQRGIRPGDLVPLVLPHGRDLVSAFFGAMLISAIPSIFTYPSEKTNPETFTRRIHQLVELAGARMIVTTPALLESLRPLLEGSACLTLSPPEVAYYPAAKDAGAIPELEKALENVQPPETGQTAYLQFTSGTTGLPKGVMLTHRASITHVKFLVEQWVCNGTDTVVSWLPLYHDMGLTTNLLIPLVSGGSIVLMSPFHWVRNPVILFQAVDKYHGTMSWMPNFAYNHCVLSVRERDMQGLDLSSWRMLGNGSEPVHYDSLQRFSQRFSAYGFRKEAQVVGYGMAENVVAAAITPINQEPAVDWVSIRALHEAGQAVPCEAGAEGARPIMSCGYPVGDTVLRIVDDQGQELPERRVGNVLLKSSTMLEGYYLRPDLTAQVLKDGWLHTGDLGYLVGGQIYLCGRSKDLVIVGGKNIQPHDVESIANGVGGVYPGRAAAFGIPDERLGTEAMVMVCELRPEVDEAGRKEITHHIRRLVMQELDIVLYDLRFVEKGWVVKTTDGKIARSANRQKYLAEYGRQG